MQQRRTVIPKTEIASSDLSSDLNHPTRFNVSVAQSPVPVAPLPETTGEPVPAPETPPAAYQFGQIAVVPAKRSATAGSVRMPSALALPSDHGEGLPEEHRAAFEYALDQPLDHVSVHTGAEADQAARSIQAAAFAVGPDLYFADGFYAPGTAQGDVLLGHELTHVVQHDRGLVPNITSSEDAVSRPDDPLEQQAYAQESRVASQAQEFRKAGRTTGVDPALTTAVWRRAVGGEGDVADEAGRSETADSVPPGVAQALSSQSSPLPPALRSELEPLFGYSFGDVRVHTGPIAERSAADVSALAYTVGPDIVFGAGQYRPDLLEGKRLLAHELTHVVQQGQAPALAGKLYRDDNDAPPAPAPDAAAGASDAAQKLLALIGDIEIVQARAGEELNALRSEDSGAADSGLAAEGQGHVTAMAAALVQLRALAAGNDASMQASVLSAFAMPALLQAESQFNIQENRPTELAARSVQISQPTAPAEQEAERIAARVMAGMRAPLRLRTGEVRIYRQIAGALTGLGTTILGLDAEASPGEAAAGPPGWAVAAGLAVVGGLLLGAGALMSRGKSANPAQDTVYMAQKAGDKVRGMTGQLVIHLARLLGQTVNGQPPDHQEDPERNKPHWWKEIKNFLKQIRDEGLSPRQLRRELNKLYDDRAIKEIADALRRAAQMMGEDPPDFPPAAAP